MGHESFQRDDEVRTSSNRSFGVVFAVVFLVIGVFPWFVDGRVRVWSLVVSAAFSLVAMLAPQVLAPLNRVWTRFGLVLHRIVSPVVLGIMFFLVVTPIGLLMRAVGKDPLRLRFDEQVRSYWIERRPPGPAPETLNNQF